MTARRWMRQRRGRAKRPGHRRRPSRATTVRSGAIRRSGKFFGGVLPQTLPRVARVCGCLLRYSLRGMFTRIVVVAVVGLTSLALAGRVAAAEGRDAREREARKACFTGNVDRGVEILVDLYGETGHPNYIYNQARCFERNGKYDQALLSYEDYLRKARDVGTAERAEVEKSIAEL